MEVFDLKESREGLYLVKPHGSMIYDGKKTLIVKGKDYKNFLNRMFYLVEDNVCFGIIRITKITPIDLEEFRKLTDKHCITELERTRWWPGKQTLYAYEFDMVTKYEEPRKVEVKPGIQTVIKEVEFLEEVDYEDLIKSPKTYSEDVKNLEDKVLLDDHRIVHAWFSSIEHGKKLYHADGSEITIKECVYLHHLIVSEMLKRGMEHGSNLEEFELAQMFTSPGGKSRVAKKIISLFPIHNIYVEPFAGSAAILFQKDKTGKEAINDLDSEIAFAYKFVQSLTEEMIQKLKNMDWSVSKEKFDSILEYKPTNDLERFHKFLYLASFSYGGTRNRFGYDFKKTYNFDKLMKLKERLSDVIIKNEDYKTVIKDFDSPETLFYLDPPYPEEWKKVGTTTEAFSMEEMKIMADLLKTIKGKFILSVQILPEYYQLFNFCNIRKLKFRRTFDEKSGSQYELLIMNFEPSEELTDYAEIGPSEDHDKGESVVWRQVMPFWSKPILLTEDFIQLIGGIPSHDKGSTGDIDILIRKAKPANDTEDVPLKFRLFRALPKELQNRLHFVYDIFHGPFTTHIPVYHLALIPAKLEVHEMEDNKEKLLKRHDELHRLYQTATDTEKAEIIQEHALIWRDMDEIGLNHDKISPNDELDKKSRFPIEEYPTIPKKFLASRSVFTPTFLKPASGYERFEFADPDSLWRIWREKYAPVKPIIIQPKWDGFSFDLMKKGNEVKMITEDQRRDRSANLPQIMTEVQHLPVHDVNLCAECVWFKNGKALEREEAIGVIVGKQSYEKEDVRMYVHDVTWIDGKDVTVLPYYQRQRLINRILRGEFLRNTPSKVIKDNKNEYLAWAKKFANVEGSEGIMAKVYDFPYITKASAETAHTPLMSKWKKSVDIEVEVEKRLPKVSTETHQPIPGQFIYYTIVRGKDNEPIPMGRTFSTSIDAKEGDILTVRSARVRGYKDETGKVIKFSLMWPKVLQKRTDMTKPTSFDELMKIAWFPEKFELSETRNFVAQHHFRGKSCHLDIRFEMDDHLEGWTLDDLVEGAVKEPVLTMEQARQISSDPSISKIDWSTGDTKPTATGQPMKILTQAKAIQPKVWLKAEGIYKPGSVGATKEFPGVIVLKDFGTFEEGVRKPYVYEYFMYGKKLKGIYLFRKLPTSGLKPTGEREPFKEPMVWFFWKRKEQVPYMLSRRALKTKTMPPDGISWLPKKLEVQIPESLRYWISGLSMDERFERLEKAIDYMKERHLELSYSIDKIEFLRCMDEG